MRKHRVNFFLYFMRICINEICKLRIVLESVSIEIPNLDLN